MAFFADALASDSRAVARFNFPYMEQGRRSPGAPKASEDAFSAVLDHLRADVGAAKVFIGGKSYGGRMASHIAAAGAQVDGLVFLGYPLHAPGRPESIRDAHLRAVRAPMLFVEGTRDPFCPLVTLEKVMSKLPAPTDLIVVDGGDHSFKVPKSSRRTSDQAWSETAASIAEWLER